MEVHHGYVCGRIASRLVNNVSEVTFQPLTLHNLTWLLDHRHARTIVEAVRVLLLHGILTLLPVPSSMAQYLRCMHSSTAMSEPLFVTDAGEA